MKCMLLSLGLALYTASANGQQLPDSIAAQLKYNTDGFMQRYHAPGIAVVFIHDQDIVFSYAAGSIDLENKTPATVDALFPVMSVTKVFTATMFMQLYERKLVRLDDAVRKYLPTYKPAGTTLLQLATHTAGLPRNAPADLEMMEQVETWMSRDSAGPAIAAATTPALLQSLATIRLEYPAYAFVSYTDRHYSNLGYEMLGLALEHAAGKSYNAYVLANICAPLGMRHTGFLGQHAVPGLAQGYRYNEDKQRFIKAPAFIPNSAMSAGGLYSTARDMAKFLSFQFRQDAAAAKILSVDNRAMMAAFRIAWKPDYPIVRHEGAIFGYRSQIAYNPLLKTGWVILTNGNDFEFGKINQVFNQLLANAYPGPSPLSPAALVGTYSLPGNVQSLQITLKDGQLFSTYLQTLTGNAPLQPSGRDHYEVHTGNRTAIGYEFLRDAPSGNILLNLDQLLWTKQ